MILCFRFCATKLQKLHNDIKQHNSTLPLRTCHCAECGTIGIWKIIICTPKQSHPKKYSSKNFVLDDTTNFQTAFPPRPKEALHFSEPSISDGLAAASFPRLARSQKHLSIDRVLAWDRLPSDIHIRLFQEFYKVYFGREFIIFTKKSHGHSGTQNSFYSGISKILKR